MLYPLYEYYKNRDMNLDEIVDNYVTRFYAKKHDGKAVLNVLNKVRKSSKIENLCGQSATLRLAPNYIDFLNTINEINWFIFRSNTTQALAVLFAALYWDEKINSVYHLKTDEELRDDIINVFKKLSIYEEMTEGEYKGRKQNDKDKSKDDNEDAERIDDEFRSNSVYQLTDEQRYVLYYFVNVFAEELSNRGGEAASKVILQIYKESLNLDDYDVSYIHYSMSFFHEEEYMERLKTINDDNTLNLFIYTCVEILDLIELGSVIVKFFDILKTLGWSEDEMKERIKKMDYYPKEHFYDKLRKTSAWDNLEEEGIEGEEIILN